VTEDRDGLELFRQRYRFDEWRDTRATDEPWFVWRFFLGGNELSGQRALRIERIEGPGLGSAVRSIWGRDEDDAAGGPLLRVELYEAPSRAEARELLLRRLAQFQSPLVERRSEAPGDVAFGMPGNRSLVFARANMVVLVANAAAEVDTVEPAAKQLDRLITAIPDVALSPVRPEIRTAEVADATPALGEPVRVELEAEDPLGRPVWFRLSARGGEFFAREDSVFYTPEAEGRHTIEIASVNGNLGSAVRQLHFMV
jgi:hypothetical protein